MFSNGITRIDIELSSRCNAGCPMCSRTGNQLITDTQRDISFEEFKHFFPPAFLQSLEQLKLCGNYGDPAVAHDLLSIHEYIWKCNPDLRVIMSTNGGIRTAKTWAKLGTLYSQSPHSIMEFHIDGLEDTNHIYRVGVKWSKIITNVKAFIAAGGQAYWYFIPFFHNEHQVEEAESLADKLGFQKFVVKMSARFDGKQPFQHAHGKLYPPTADRFQIEDMQVDGELKCLAEARKQVYVDSWGRLFPCCWTASRYNRTTGWIMHQDPTIISLRHRTIREIVDDPVINKWIDGLYNDKASVCHKRCTGSHIHVIEESGNRYPQKLLWYGENS